MKLRAITKEEIEIVRQWRNEDLSYLRTPFLLTQEMQEEFYINTICNRLSDARFWAIEDKEFVGMAGLVNIQWENSLAEISLIITPTERKKSYGEQAVKSLLLKGFYQLNMNNIYGECYLCNPSIVFWKKMIDKYKGTMSLLPNRKYWNGDFHNSIYFNFERGCV
jgi:RimJ/RimL family protein N-acetyltransferase